MFFRYYSAHTFVAGVSSDVRRLLVIMIYVLLPHLFKIDAFIQPSETFFLESPSVLPWRLCNINTPLSCPKLFIQKEGRFV